MHPGTRCIPGPGASWHKTPSFHTFQLASPSRRGWLDANCLLGAVPGLLRAGNYLGKCSLAPKFVQRDFLTIFSHGCTSQCLSLILQQGCNLRAAGFIFREKCCKCCLPAPAHLDIDLGYSSKSSRNVLMKGSVPASLLCASGTQHLPGSALDCRITLWEGSGSECQRAADYFVISEQ